MKKKRVYRFARAARGYNMQSVDAYIDAEKSRNDTLLNELRERISLLNEQCDCFKQQIAELKGREEKIKAAFVAASDNAEKLTLEAQARYKLELDRLQLFRTKWIGAYDQLKERYHFDKDALNMESVAIAAELELRKQLKHDFSLSDGDGDEMENYFHREVLRLATQPSTQTGGEASPAVQELKEKLKEADARLGQRAKTLKPGVDALDKGGDKGGAAKAGDSATKNRGSAAAAFDDVPTESLEELCRALGLGARSKIV